MILNPNLQKLLYGTLVAAGVSVTGVLWHSRTEPNNIAKLVDVIEVTQSCQEKVLATQRGGGDSRVITNQWIDWVPEANGRGFQSWDKTQGTNIFIPYYQTNGFVDKVWTNDLTGGYRCAPLTGGSLTGSTSTNRYIWNAYTNVSISGFVDYNVNGNYSYVTSIIPNTLTEVRKAIPSFNSTRFYMVQSSDRAYLYTNASFYLWDFGPRESRGPVVDPFGTTPRFYSTLITTKSTIPARRYATAQGSSMFMARSSEWARVDGNPGYTITEQPLVTPVGNFSSNIMRDAACRWYVNRLSPWLLPAGSGNLYYDPLYHVAHPVNGNPDAEDLLFLQPDPTKVAVDAVEAKAREVMGVGGFMDPAKADGSDHYVGVTNRSLWSTTNYSLIWSNACENVGVVPDAVTYTNHSPPTTQDMERLSLVLKQMRANRLLIDATGDGSHGGTDSVIWEALPGDGSYTLYGYGTAATWAAAKAAAEADLAAYPGDFLPCAFTYGCEIFENDFQAVMMMSKRSMHWPDACPLITNQVDFYVQAIEPQFTLSGLSVANSIFSTAMSPTLVLSNFVYVGSSPQDMPQTNPACVFGDIINYPAWCDEPVKVGATIGKSAKGWQVLDSEAIIKWNWNYNHE